MNEDPKKEVRGRAQVTATIQVTHNPTSPYSEDEIATVKISDEEVLDSGDGSLLDNEYAFTRLLARVCREAQEKAERIVGDQWVERTDEAEAQRRQEQLEAAERHIASLPDEPERRAARAILGGFLGHPIHEPSS